MKKNNARRGEKITAVGISVFFLLFYVFYQSTSIYGGDAGDLVTAAYVRGVAHPPGYPLYTFIAWLLTKLPFYTVAWRVSLLSSIPAALALGLFFQIAYKLLKQYSVALIATCFLGFSYLYWLYAVVPEVFGLHVLLTLTISFLLLQYKETAKQKYLFLASLVFGLALTHHHTILFMVPAFLFIVRSVIHKQPHKVALLARCGGAVVVGLLPYVYVYFASLAHPPINWENPQTFEGFFRLVTRAIYGTFRSNNNYSLYPLERYNQLKVMLETIVIDFTKVGIGLALVGFYHIYKKNKDYFWFLFLGFFCTGPFFIFYAGFPSLINFHLGTSERFLILPYLFITLWLGLGIQKLVQWLGGKMLFYKITPKKIPIVAIFWLLPLVMFITNSYKIWPLRRDTTAEKLAYDLLSSTSDSAILFLTDDTTIFDTQYIYYTQGGPSAFGGKMLLSRVTYPFYIDIVRREYPQLNLVNVDNAPDKIKQIIDNNYDHFPIYSAGIFDVGKGYVWLPFGLLNRLYKTEDLQLVTTTEFIAENERLFAVYQNPLHGALGTYLHVMLADVLRIYGNSRREVGEKLVLSHSYELAEKYFREAVQLEPELIDNTLQLGNVLILQKKCEEARDLLTAALKTSTNSAGIYKTLVDLYTSCIPDEAARTKYHDLLESKLKQYQIDLKNL